MNFASSIAPIAADGSGSFEVQFSGGETLFDYTVAVSITSGSAGNTAYSGSVNSNGSPQESGFTVQHTAGSGLYRIDFPAGTFAGSAGKFLIATVTPIGRSHLGELRLVDRADRRRRLGLVRGAVQRRRDAVRLRRRRLDQLTRAPC